MRSLSREEVCSTFGLTPEALDALLDSGRLLCQFTKGEVRIPLAQLEQFFREGLIQAIEAGAREPQSREPGAGGREPEVREPEVREPGAGGREPEMTAAPALAPVRGGEAAGDRTDDEPATSTLAPQAVAEQTEETEAAPAAPPAPAAAPARGPRPAAPEIDFRVSPRFVPRRQIDGLFGDMRFTVVQMSRSGLRIRHTEELVAGTESKLRFALLNPAPRSFVMRGRVVWTSIAMGPADRRFYISGLRITEHTERLANAIDILNAAHDLQPERRHEERRKADGDVAAEAADATAAEIEEAALPEGVTDDDVELVMKAAQHFAEDPVEANRWYARGRFATSDPQVRRHAPKKPREREEVLGIWEYLERRVEVRSVTDILAWMQRTRDAATAARP